LRSGNGICGNARRIIIRSAGDDTGTKGFEKLF
jgi:hypothetical protein